MIPLKTIEELISKHSLLEKELSAGDVDKKLFAEKSKEYSDLNEIIDDAKKYILFEANRWDIETTNEKLIKLPINYYNESLVNYLKLRNNNNFKKYKIFDYRVKDQLILK